MAKSSFPNNVFWNLINERAIGNHSTLLDIIRCKASDLDNGLQISNYFM